MHDGRATVSIETPDDRYGPVILGLRGEHQVRQCAGRRPPSRSGATTCRHSRCRATRSSADCQDVDWPGRLELIRIARRSAGAARCRPQRRRRAGARCLSGALAPGTAGARHRHDARQARRGHRRPAAAGRLLDHRNGRRHTARDSRATSCCAHRRAMGRPVCAPSPIRRRPSSRRSRRARSVCVTGSIFLIGAVRDRLRRRAILR